MVGRRFLRLGIGKKKGEVKMDDYDRFAYCKLGCPLKSRDNDCAALRKSGLNEICAIQNCAFMHWAKALKGEELPTLPPRKKEVRKYNEYDEVLTMHLNRVHVGKIEKVIATSECCDCGLQHKGDLGEDVERRKIVYRYVIYISSHKRESIERAEKDLFPTKQALLESL